MNLKDIATINHYAKGMYKQKPVDGKIAEISERCVCIRLPESRKFIRIDWDKVTEIYKH